MDKSDTLQAVAPLAYTEGVVTEMFRTAQVLCGFFDAVLRHALLLVKHDNSLFY